jgi:hypothetical protein
MASTVFLTVFGIIHTIISDGVSDSVWDSFHTQISDGVSDSVLY